MYAEAFENLRLVTNTRETAETFLKKEVKFSLRV